MKHVLILVQNLSVPLDRRVWQESRALVDDGFVVSVICPRGDGDSPFDDLEGVQIHRYEAPTTREGTVGYLHEFVVSWLRTVRLTWRVHRRRRLDAIQACNPPDTLWAIALPYKATGVRFVYDQHDLCPELFAVKFPGRKGLLPAGLRFLERASYRTADAVISPNELYREVARTRGKVPDEDLTIVTSAPDPEEMRAREPTAELRNGARFLCCYLGIMGPQDGVDLLLEAIDVIVHQRSRKDVHFALLGFGDCLDDLKHQCSELGLDPWVTFTGRADRQVVADYLSTADIGLCPDPSNPFNDRSTMNKSLEYQAFGLPVVAFDLPETRLTVGDAGLFVPGDDPERFADAILALLDDPDDRAARGAFGRRRIETELGWPYQHPRYTARYRALLDWPRDGDRDDDRDVDVRDVDVRDAREEVVLDLRPPDRGDVRKVGVREVGVRNGGVRNGDGGSPATGPSNPPPDPSNREVEE